MTRHHPRGQWRHDCRADQVQGRVFEVYAAMAFSTHADFNLFATH